LDGDGDRVPGDDFGGTFTVAEPAAIAVALSLVDFVRGPGQEVNVPADTAFGIPLMIDNGPGVRNGVIEIDYNPAYLNITGATVGAGNPAGAAVTLDTSDAGTASLVFSSPFDLPMGEHVLVNLQATVPSTSGILGSQQVLNIRFAAFTDVLGVPYPMIRDHGLHLVNYFGDVSGNARINAADAAQVARFAALIDTGFAGSVLSDPRLVGDISGNARVNAGDASLIAQFAALIDVPEIPPIPSAILMAVAGDSPTPPAFVQPGQDTDSPTDLGRPSNTEPGWDGFAYPPTAVDLIIASGQDAPYSVPVDGTSLELVHAIDELCEELGKDALTSGGAVN
jgi:hypothetical protein